MQKVNRPQGKWRNAVFLLIALPVLAADQLSKVWIRLYPEGQSIFEAGFFRIIRVHNTGAAFGLFPGNSFLLIVIRIIVIGLILFYAFFIYHWFPSLDRISNRVALGLVLGGAIGNLVDGICFGYVIDFIDFGFWPAFNIADSAITVGLVLFAFSILSLARGRRGRYGRSL